MSQASYLTEEENFWFGEFGNNYSIRNDNNKIFASNTHFFSKVLTKAKPLHSCIEFGANIGMNLLAIKKLYPAIHCYGLEINQLAARKLEEFIGHRNVFTGSIFNYEIEKTFDLALVKGFLIHINPDKLLNVYQKLYHASHRYILICEYYNPVPVTVLYRGHQNRLYKRDFCGEMLDLYPDLNLIDYGFVYNRDLFPQDDVTWFLLKK